MSPTTQHLMRLWRSLPMSQLKQGATLSIRSSLTQPTHLLVEAEWRDDGRADLKQVFSKCSPNPEATMTTLREQDQMTSIGRSESHIVLKLDEAVLDESEASNVAGEQSKNSLLPHARPKPAHRAMLDDGTIVSELKEAKSEENLRRIDYHDGIAHLTADGQVEEAGTFLTVKIPEKTNLICELPNGGSITIAGKVEGDVKLYTADGDIIVKKLRGHEIDLETDGSGSIIYAADVLEAQKLTLRTSGRIRAKQIHGNQIDIRINSSAKRQEESVTKLWESDDEGSLVDISSLYVSGNGGANVSVVGPRRPQRRAIRIKSHHGPIRTETSNLSVPIEDNPMNGQIYPLVELGGVNGNCEVSIEDTLHEKKENKNWNTCMVHVDSLSPDSVSLITVDSGGVAVTLDRKAEADLRLLSCSSAECLIETGAMLAEEEDPNLLLQIVQNLPKGPALTTAGQQRISVETSAFTARPVGFATAHVEYVDGWTENKSAEPDSRFERKSNGATGSVGKIRMDGAAEQALHGFSSSKAETGQPIYQRPLIAVAGTGIVKVETVSWLGAIARRYGLDEDHREAGRTASRRGRSLAPQE